MKARAIIELDEMPINCFKRSVRVGCKPICPLEYLCRNPKQQHRYSNEFQDGCPLREVPEWTDEDAKAARNFLAALIEHGGVAQVDAKSLTVLGVENNVKE